MIQLKDITKEVSTNLNLDRDLVEVVCKHVFNETMDIMKSDDTKDILFNGLFKFKLKKRYKEDKLRPYSK